MVHSQRDGLTLVEHWPLSIGPLHWHEERLTPQRRCAIALRPHAEQYRPPVPVRSLHHVRVTRIPHLWVIPVEHERIDTVTVRR